jgi:hypothetical protein
LCVCIPVLLFYERSSILALLPTIERSFSLLDVLLVMSRLAVRVRCLFYRFLESRDARFI